MQGRKVHLNSQNCTVVNLPIRIDYFDYCGSSNVDVVCSYYSE